MIIPSDAELIQRIKEGDISAFEVLVRRYHAPVISFSFRIVHNQAIAEEVAQDTLFAVYRTIESIDVTKKFTTYLFEIAKNQSISMLRKNKHHESLHDLEIFFDAELYEILAQKDQSDAVQKSILTLDVSYQKILNLYYFQDLPYREIAKREKLPINTVRTKLRRAKDRLKEALEKEQIF